MLGLFPLRGSGKCSEDVTCSLREWMHRHVCLRRVCACGCLRLRESPCVYEYVPVCWRVEVPVCACDR